ncbi:class I SAM-dependent methyltransferase [Pseudonocardia acaciae]|uniref:class I SAM-dependent methyltransferase n=1 Tax=Pseudonocardia acaciae TaxID=551276 RepID=UPI00055DD42D|nr:class I SAM-dependent methyltransferase [Pseudonocardia acaciae]
MTVHRGPREWDAVRYDAQPLPHERWGRGVLAALPLAGDERVLDLGAGTGRDTEALLERLPTGHVVAVDGSAAMLAQLRDRLAGVGPQRLTVLRADLTEPLVLDRPVDAVFSVATLHWLPDHAAVFRSVAGVLRPGGLLRAEWGGAGQLAGIESALDRLGLPRIGQTCNFATAERTAELLCVAGFTDVDVTLTPDPVRLAPGGELEAYLGTVVLGAVLDGLPAERHRSVVDAVVARLPEPTVEYVRLKAAARRMAD